MEWSKAKNYILILLVVINCILLVLNIEKNNEKVLSNKQIENITEVCANNNITIGCQLPKKTESLQQLYAREYNYDYVALQQIFFGGISEVKRTTDLNSIIFTKNNDRLVVENSKAVFSGAMIDSQEVVNSLMELLGEFEIVKKIGNKECYYQSYDGMPVFSNYILVEKNIINNTINVSVNYSSLVRLVGGKENTIGADEAIYCAMNSINEDIVNEKTVNSVEMGYYDSRSALTEEAVIAPCYAINVNENMYFVNAYTGLCYR